MRPVRFRPLRRAARLLRASAPLLIAVAAACRAPAPAPILSGQPADWVFRGGAVRTLDPARPSAEAVAVRGGKIVLVGSEAEAAPLVGPGTRVVSLQGRLLLPGFHDSHVHPVSGGIRMEECELSTCKTPEEVLRTVEDYVRAHPVPEGVPASAAWIRGRGWQLPVFPDANPKKEALDAIVTGRPVYLESADGHSTWVNSDALAFAHITAATPDPPAGRIERDPATGAPSGTLREAAGDIVEALLPKRTQEESNAGLRRALRLAAQLGITSLTEANANERTLRAYQTLQDAGELTARVSISLATDEQGGPAQVARLEALRAATHGPLLTASAAKIFVDGVIESKTAALLEAYLGPGNPGSGLPKCSPEQLDALVAALDRAKFQVHVHAIGDRGIRMTLDAFERARAANGPRDSRHHIAHLELIDPADIPRFAALGVAANFQPLWAYADSYITDLTVPFLGPTRSRWLYPIGSVAATGAAVVCGSDWSVTSMNPLEGIQVGVTRRDPEAEAGPAWIPEETMTLDAMLDCYTRRGAWLDFREQETGTIEAGKEADLIVLDRNLFEIPPQEIHEAKVLLTLLGGAEIWRAPGFSGN